MEESNPSYGLPKSNPKVTHPDGLLARPLGTKPNSKNPSFCNITSSLNNDVNSRMGDGPCKISVPHKQEIGLCPCKIWVCKNIAGAMGQIRIWLQKKSKGTSTSKNLLGTNKRLGYGTCKILAAKI